MKPPKKAKELIDKFKSTLRADNRSWEYEAKKCALICVDEILESIENSLDCNSEYWNEVKIEIEKP